MFFCNVVEVWKAVGANAEAPVAKMPTEKMSELIFIVDDIDLAKRKEVKLCRCHLI